MDRIATYSEIIQRVIQEVADYIPAEEGIRVEAILDEVHGHFELLTMGWQNQ